MTVSDPHQQQLEAYLAARSELIGQDRAQRPAYRSAGVDDASYRAAEKALKSLRAIDLKEIFSAEGAFLSVDERYDHHHVHPGMGFLRSKEKIAQSELFKALRSVR